MALTVELANVRKTYPSTDGVSATALRVDSLSVSEGEHVCVVGGSGTGKTTLLNVIAGIVVPDSGDVKVCGTDLGTMSESGRDRFRARNIGYLFQVFNLLQPYSALENVALPLTLAGTASVRDARARARELLERIGLGAKTHRRPANLSVGEQQRVALARAIACRPRLLLADEPTASLDPRNAQSAMDILREVAGQNGASLIVVTHDERVKRAFERVVTLEPAA